MTSLGKCECCGGPADFVNPFGIHKCHECQAVQNHEWNWHNPTYNYEANSCRFAAQREKMRQYAEQQKRFEIPKCEICGQRHTDVSCPSPRSCHPWG